MERFKEEGEHHGNAYDLVVKDANEPKDISRLAWKSERSSGGVLGLHLWISARWTASYYKCSSCHRFDPDASHRTWWDSVIVVGLVEGSFSGIWVLVAYLLHRQVTHGISVYTCIVQPQTKLPWTISFLISRLDGLLGMLSIAAFSQGLVWDLVDNGYALSQLISGM